MDVIATDLSRVLSRLLVELNLRCAYELYRQGEYEGAIQIADQILVLDHTNSEAQDLRMEALKSLRDQAIKKGHVASGPTYTALRRQYVEEFMEKFVLLLYAVARTELEDQNTAFIGETYSLEAGVAWHKPEGFEGEPFDLPLRSLFEPIAFEILVHAGTNTELLTEWHKHLQYEPDDPQPQLVEFNFRTVAVGHCSLTVDFYQERRWLRTIRFEFESVKAPELAAVPA